MEAMICADDARRELVRASNQIGLDYVEVQPDGLSLRVYFLGHSPASITDRQVVLRGGTRIRGIRVRDVQLQRRRRDENDWMFVTLDKTGDFSTYTLALQGVEDVDPFYDHVDFTFSLDCPPGLDCLAEDECPPEVFPPVEINYLARDYASLRQVILDRLALTMPDWRERHVPDAGIALVELLAYTGDYLSYYQDAVGTEAYLGTARSRISVRRHARLVDYRLHEGVNSRVWLFLEVEELLRIEPDRIYFLSGLHEGWRGSTTVIAGSDLASIPADAYDVFEPVLRAPIQLAPDLNELHFYTWGQRECCLPRGATSASLYLGALPTALARASTLQAGTYPDGSAAAARALSPASGRLPAVKAPVPLQAGMCLLFEEVIGPDTGAPEDADPTHRQVVRLTGVTPRLDTLFDPPARVLDIEWSGEDALTFPLCISSVSQAPLCDYLENVSVARGNLVLVDDGRTLQPEELPLVPLAHREEECDCEGGIIDVELTPGRFYPRLDESPIVFRQPVAAGSPTAKIMQQSPVEALPQIALTALPAAPDGLSALFDMDDLDHLDWLISRLKADAKDREPRTVALRHKLSPQTLAEIDKQQGFSISDVKSRLMMDLSQMVERWEPQHDLLSSGTDDRHFVAEIDNEGVTWLRFGDNELGQRPQPGTLFVATYRIGGGNGGPIGAESITHLVVRRGTLEGVVKVRNPLPASRATAPEPIAEAKLFAPGAFRKKIERAVSPDDYVALVKRDFGDRVQRAAAQLQWTGSWYEVQLAIDPLGSGDAGPELLDEIESYFNAYRRIGHEVRARSAIYVPLEIEISVCVLPGYLRGHVKAELLHVFSRAVSAGGRKGLFHPDNLWFGQGVSLSRLVAAAQAVEGVESAQVTKLQRQFAPPNREIEFGILPIGPLEVARVDNDPNFPERGQVNLVLTGGR